MVDPVTAGAVISAGGSLINSFFNNRSQKSQNARNNAREDTKLQRAVEDGRLAGLSPLASIGGAGFTPNPASYGTGLQDAGRALGHAVASKAPPNPAEAVVLAEVQSRTLFNQARTREIDHMIANGNQGNPMPQLAPDGRRIEHSTIIVKTVGGKEIVMPNNELMEGLTPKEIAMFNALAAGSRAIEPGSLPYRAWQNFNKYLKKHGGALTGRRK